MTFSVLDNLTCDLLLSKHLSEEIISMSIVLEVDRRMLEPRVWRSKVMPKLSWSDVLKGKLKKKHKNKKVFQATGLEPRASRGKRTNKVLFTFTPGSQKGKRLTS